MKFRLIEAEKAEHKISWLCKVLGVSRAGYYGWLRRGPSLRSLGDAELARLIVTIYDGSLQTYGAPRIQLELRDEHDVRVGRKRVARLMRNEYETLDDARSGIGGYVDRYHERPHSGLDYRTPLEVRQTQKPRPEMSTRAGSRSAGAAFPLRSCTVPAR